MIEIKFLPELAPILQKAALEKFKAHSGHRSLSNSAFRAPLVNYLIEKFGIKFSLHTFYVNIHINKTKAYPSMEHASTRGFVILASYLSDLPHLKNFDGMDSIVDLLKRLREKEIAGISPELINLQLHNWGMMKDSSNHYYALYYSLGENHPDIALLEMDDQWRGAKLKFYRGDHAELNGTIDKHIHHSNLYLTLKDGKTGRMAFLTLAYSSKNGLAGSVRLDGYYSSTMVDIKGKPVVGKVIAVPFNYDVAEKNALDKLIPEEYASELRNQQLIQGEQKNSRNSAEAGKFKESYLIYRLDSTKTRVNCYRLKIATNGNFKYDMGHGENVSVYTGRAYFINATCLILAVDLKDHAFYTATYIFYLGSPEATVNNIGGVYAAVGYDQAPVCGRAILNECKEQPSVPHPYAIGTDLFFSASDERSKILRYLAGTENNLIKTSHKKNHFNRSVDYKSVFFVYACHCEDDSKLKYLKFAINEGFRDVPRIQKEREEGVFKAFKDNIIIEEKSGAYLIEIIEGGESKNYRIKIKS